VCVLPFGGKNLKFFWRLWIRGKRLSGYATWRCLHATHLSSKFEVCSFKHNVGQDVCWVPAECLTKLYSRYCCTIWPYRAVERWLFGLLVSLLLLMKLDFGMPWCTLRRFAPRNSIMYSMGTLNCFFQITLELIGLCIPRSIENLHHQSLALLKGEVVHIYAKNHADCCYLLCYPFPLFCIYTPRHRDYLWSSSQPHFGPVAGMPQFPIHAMDIYELRYVASWFITQHYFRPWPHVHCAFGANIYGYWGTIGASQVIGPFAHM